ncbi:uncharacterized protein FOMMEDRAFT_160236 [Fomitiporia mediterranea MF3/22]|uniref:uncharacterized protein n=1 Tax=Fomitiporia mediterranea (strain MF3/22) TaxID=694068 RepID=UPI0004407FAD|nr:uncharacterized protein FOMMEDRAFT_160236 [Fomitiporia mediterranea MF3/22]EJC99795.1 hypothetical protein FOMMEDRAFT_160236 [Fomitiporia mediterranea MF3/22]
MTDVAGLILGIPSTVKGFVDAARVLQSYHNLDRDHKESVKRAVFISEVLEYYACLVDTDKLGDIDNKSYRLMSDAFTHAVEAHCAAARVVEEWSVKLGIQTGSGSKEELEKKSVPRRQRMMDLLYSINERFRNSQKGEKKNKRPIAKLAVDINYLVLGRIEIDEASDRMERWISSLSSILMILPLQHLVRFDEQKRLPENWSNSRAMDMRFVVRARNRVQSNIAPNIIDPSQIQYASGIDAIHNCPIQRLEDGPYAGCILDPRDLGLRIDLYDEARNDTDKIYKLFSEKEGSGGHKQSASVGILPCCGYIDLLEQTTQYLVFRLPPEAGAPKTLRNLLLDCKPMHPLNTRLDFSIQLATSVLIVHSLDLIHKNIRPDSIIVTESIGGAEYEKFPYRLGTPYLVAFDQARTEDGPSQLRSYRGAMLFESLYQHPRHVTSTTRQKYEMRDDIYSLGVCLLEVGIWKSLFKWDTGAGESGGFVGDEGVLALQGDRFNKRIQELGLSTDQDKSWARRDALVMFARSELAVSMGETFRNVVVDCLLFGSGGTTYEERLGKTYGTKDVVVKNQSVMFVEDVLERLRALTFSR